MESTTESSLVTMRRKTSMILFFTKLWWVSVFLFFFFFCSILRRWESFPAFNKLPDFWLDSWSHNTYLYVSMLAEIFSQKYVRVCMCTTVLKNLVDAQCYNRWFNSWVLTFREEKKTWNIKQLPNVKIIWVKDIRYMQTVRMEGWQYSCHVFTKNF